MRRIDIVNELNRLTLRYNLTWSDVVTDADKAIYQINTYLGVEYPLLSERMLSDDSTYTDRVGSVDEPIIKDQYFHSVIIPYMAMEILARDEEFTTIYSKYQQEFELGKYNMFKNEFNFVPDRYKRQRPEGVFFPSNNKGRKR